MKDSVKRIEGQATDRGKIFTNHISNKGPVSTIHTELSKLNSKKIQLEK